MSIKEPKNLLSIDLSKYSFPNENRPKTSYTYANTYNDYLKGILDEHHVEMPNLCRRSLKPQNPSLKYVTPSDTMNSSVSYEDIHPKNNQSTYSSLSSALNKIRTTNNIFDLYREKSTLSNSKTKITNSVYKTNCFDYLTTPFNNKSPHQHDKSLKYDSEMIINGKETHCVNCVEILARKENKSNFKYFSRFFLIFLFVLMCYGFNKYIPGFDNIYFYENMNENSQKEINHIEKYFTSTLRDVDIKYGVLLKQLEELNKRQSKVCNLQANNYTYISIEKMEEFINKSFILYNADKTGMTDFASEFLGGSIFFTRCTEAYDGDDKRWFSFFGIPLTRIHVSPRVVIQVRTLLFQLIY
jgi:hypothetical protein